MSPRYLALLFGALLGMTVVFSYLSLQHQTANDSNDAQVSLLFRQIKLLSASADREILQLKIRNQTSFDQLTALRLQHDRHIAELETALQSTFSVLESQKLLAQYRVLNRRSESIISQFKSAIAYTENSFSYSFLLADEVLDDLASHSYHTAWRMTRQLQVDVLLGYTTQQPLSEQELSQRFNAIRGWLRSSDTELLEVLSILQRHLTILFQGQASINASLDNLFALERERVLDEAHSSYLERIDEQRHIELVYLVAAIASAVLLLLIVALAIYRFIRLASEKESLTFAVNESAASLQRSNLELQKEAQQRQEAEQELKNAAIMYENCPLGVVICDAEQRVIMANPAYEKITGTPCHEMTGHRPGILRKELLPEELLANIRLAIAASGKWQGEMPVVTAQGQVIPAEVSIITTFKGDQLSRYIIMLADISERKRNEDIIYRQANFDTLTQLPNRNLFYDRVTHTLADSERNRKRFALLFIDIDNFKRINDTLGHTVGDQLLQAIATRLSSVVREVDTLSRFGGDEFVLVVEGIADALQIEPLLVKLVHCISEPVTIESSQHPALHVSGSVGVAVYPDDGRDLSTLIRCADMAMYRAKDKGKNTYCFYQEKMNEEAREYMALETQLRSALTNQQMLLMYQPIFSLPEYSAETVEALLRWRTADGEWVAPDKFIPIAEDTGMIIEIGEWVLRQACQQLVIWHQQLNPRIRMTVNISAVQFLHPEFSTMLRRVLAETGVPASCLVLEITESLFLEDSDSRISRLMADIRAEGVQIALDDFGTGYAALSYLKRFPVDVIKIDRSFVADLNTFEDDGSLVKAIISMAGSLGMEVVAEGVETAEQLAWLNAAGCDKVQGFYCSKPKLEAEVVTELQVQGCVSQ